MIKLNLPQRTRLMDAIDDWYRAQPGDAAGAKWRAVVALVERFIHDGIVERGSDWHAMAAEELDRAEMSTAGHGDPHDRVWPPVQTY